MNVSTGLLPVYTKGEGTEGPVVHRLTRFFLRERIGRVRVDVDVRSSTGLLGPTRRPTAPIPSPPCSSRSPKAASRRSVCRA